MHPLIQRLFDDYGYAEVSHQTHADFIGQSGFTVLFFAGDPKRFRDTTDVAVVLPELVKAFNGGLTAGVVTSDAEKELQRHYGFSAWPALVFLRDGGYLGAITEIQNWNEYLQTINTLMSAEVTRPPGFKVPVVNG
ncbi:MAG: hydrogenase-1 expression HyaE [gamma proteobacterium symbiont of Bathyaustriella thionipta]|nr:hydrogenase-1 expression HyaE [gamma proteobacterium symbiont of Bathyaustriella thionipta]